MSKYVVVSDHSGKGDMQCIDAVAKVLEDAGHEVAKGGVDANSESRLRQEGSDTIGVFLVNGACLATFLSLDDMVKGGNCSHVYMGCPKPIMASPFNNHDEWTNQSQKLKCLNESWIPDSYRQYDGKWTLQEASDNIENITCVYGDTCEDVAQNILNGDTGGGGETTSQGEGSIMSGWESITDLLKPLDGEAMVVVRGDVVLVQRIYPPESTQLWVYEGINVVEDSVKVSDYSPEIYNTFVIKWGASFENEFEMCFNKHKELFGERKKEVNATYIVPIGETEGEEETYDGSQGLLSDEQVNEGLWGGVKGIVGSIFPTVGITDRANDAANSIVYGPDGQRYGGDSQEEQEAPVYQEVPITDEGEAYLFGLKEVGKACRKSGHQIDCKVIGNKRFEVGEWCRVYLPSFREDCIMFISKVSNESSADSEWLTSLTLVDYPPSLGSGQSNSPTSSEDETGEDMGDDYTSLLSEGSDNPDATDSDVESGDASAGGDG